MFGKLVKCYLKFSLLLAARQGFLTWPEIGFEEGGVCMHVENVNRWLQFLEFKAFYPYRRAPGVPKRSLCDMNSSLQLWPSAVSPTCPSYFLPISAPPLSTHPHPLASPSFPLSSPPLPPLFLMPPLQSFRPRSSAALVFSGTVEVASQVTPGVMERGGRERLVCVETVTW